MKIFTNIDLAVLELVERPMWVFDVEKPGMVWVNQAALPMWSAETVDDLLQRDFSDLSEASIQRLAEYVRRLERGEHFTDQWTVYPNGVPTSVRLEISPIRYCSARVSLLVTATWLDSEELDDASLRGVEALRHLPAAVCQFDRQGQVIFQNPESLRIFGPAAGALGFLPARFADAVEGERVLGDVKRGEVVELETPLETMEGTRWFQVALRQSTDPVTGDPSILFSANDITDKRHARERIQRAKASAEAANRAKSAFLAAVSHELRTPLTTILGFSELLSETELSDLQQRYLKAVRNSGKSLRSLIDDLIDLARLETDSVALDDAPLLIDAIVAQAVSAVRVSAEAKGLPLMTQIDQSVPRKLHGDSNRIQQILTHLCDNAVKFTDDGHVSVFVRRAQGYGAEYVDRHWVRFEVEDTGVGIEAEDLDRIFDEFTQLDGSYTRKQGGTGLGLTICRLVAERMGGKIGVASTPGQGSRFWVDLPLRSDQPVESAPAVKNRDSLHILVVEDNPVNQVLVRTILKRMGHQATVAGNGMDALHAVTQGSFDLVFMDIQMPKMDGIEATREIRARGFSPETLPIVALTANLNPDSQVTYLQAGMNACIAKPFQVPDIAAAISRWTLASHGSSPSIRPSTEPSNLD